MTLATASEFSTWNGGTGVYRSSAVADALILAEAKVGEWLSTPTTPTQFIEEYPWPVDLNKIELQKVRLITVDKVEALYSDGQCNWNTTDECHTVFDARHSVIRLRDPYRWWCSNQRCPERMRITYTAGFTAAEGASGTEIGTILRAGIFNAMLGFLQTSIGLNARGNVFISSYSAAGYNESRQLPERSGAEELINEHFQNGKELVRTLVVKRFISLRARKRW